MATYSNIAYDTPVVHGSVFFGIGTFDCWDIPALTDMVVFTTKALLVDGGGNLTTYARWVTDGTLHTSANLTSAVFGSNSLAGGFLTSPVVVSDHCVWIPTNSVVGAGNLTGLLFTTLATLLTSSANLTSSAITGNVLSNLVVEKLTVSSLLSTQSSSFCTGAGNLTSLALDGGVIAKHLFVDAGGNLTATYAYKVYATSLVYENVFSHDLTFNKSIGSNVAYENYYAEDQSFSGALHTAWVTHLQQLAMSRYDGLNSESMAQIGNQIIGFSEQGLFNLVSTQPVSASITTGKLNNKSMQLKKLENLYVLGESSDGELLLTVTIPDEWGNDESYDFDFQVRESTSAKSNRVITGKGLRSCYWQFQITNPNQGYFSLRDVRGDLIDTKRRV